MLVRSVFPFICSLAATHEQSINVCIWKADFLPYSGDVKGKKTTEMIQANAFRPLHISWFNQHPPSLFDSKCVSDAFLQQIAFLLCVFFFSFLEFSAEQQSEWLSMFVIWRDFLMTEFGNWIGFPFWMLNLMPNKLLCTIKS